jgi:sugar lactone lactonase YvrE
MMKKLLFLTICLLLIVAVGANAQWKFVKYFPDTVKYPNKQWTSGVNNGIAVDPDGKIWIQSYIGNADSVPLTGGGYKTCGVIQVYYPNGTPASFSPIKILSGKDVPSGATVADTLGSSGYGLSVDPSSGNIVSVKTSGRLWKIDYKTGKGMLRIVSPIPGYTSSLDAVGIDNFGEVFCGPVAPGGAIAILNPDFTAAGTVTTVTNGYSRAVAVSGDGNDVYFTIFGNLKTYVYHSDNGSLGPYALKDSIMNGLCPESATWQPKTGYLWTTSGNVTSGMPTAPWQGYRWYAWSLTSKKIVDSIAEYDPQIPMYGNDIRPRGIAFNKTGDTAYVAEFNTNSLPPASWVQVFAKSGATSVEQDKNVIPTGYTLSQNYPNPFNPSTQIRFTITQTGMTTLKVYDVMGREVATLVDESLSPGAYTVRFDASHLSSGTYMYVLTSGSARLTNKMMLVK